MSPNPSPEGAHPAARQRPETPTSPTILVVDDSTTLRTVVRMMLAAHQFNVLEAATADEAFELVQRQRPDLMLLDLNMPDVDGLSLLRRVRGLHGARSLPMVVMTTSSSAEKRAEAVVLGAKAWIQKPAPQEMLIKTIQTVLQMPARAAATPP